MLRGPGKYLVMMIWWILVFFFVQLYSDPLWSYVSSYLVYFIAFAFTLGGAILLNLLESRLRLWSRRRRWGKLIIIATAYTVAIGASFVLTIVLDSYDVVADLGGDAGGSFGLLYLPSIVFYLIAGAVVCTLVSVVEALKKVQQTST